MIELIIGIVGGGGITAVLVKLLSRKLETAQAARIRMKMEMELAEYWQKLSQDLEKRVECLEKRLKEELEQNVKLRIENNSLRRDIAVLTARMVEMESELKILKGNKEC